MLTKSVKSFAKINIALCIKSKREDGYHELDTIMVPVEFHDTLLIDELKTGLENYVTIDDFTDGIVKYNLVSDCLEAMAKKYNFNQKFRVYIHKNIPMQAGLGGGSSNAAAAMKAINSILKINASEDELVELAKDYGADIPFFLKNGAKRCNGIGEVMRPIEIKNDYYVLLVKPQEGMSTKECFMYCDKKPYKQVDMDKIEEALKIGDDDMLAQYMDNSMYDAAVEAYPVIGEIVQYLKDKGLTLVSMSGSGSTVFALSTDKALLKKVMLEIEDKWFTELTRIIK